MTEPAERDIQIDLAQALMAEITGRLEDLAAKAGESQLALNAPSGFAEKIRGVLVLVEAHRELLGERPEPPGT